ncbi:DeoR/GlpR family DNA-binding transcription regulator [Actinomadura gamaensis]|uniref:Lactose phosphotransferase system repressor n=1 Tax=Actinomadura gamaensis TaxID=1763541 RepID=A0ABV9TVS7_9ACTN
MTDDALPSTTGPDADGGSTRRRREAIRKRVTDEGFVRIKDLAAAHDVSAMTIHRDLDELQSTGWLRKVRGGATAEPSASYHGDVRHRRQAMAAEKHALAAAAAGLVGAGATVMIDESTTALELARLLPGRGPVTVITNFLAAVNALTGEPGVDLIALGGAYYPAYDAFLGLRTTEAIRSLRADLLFMSTTAITNGQCYHQSQETVAVKRALMDSADRRVLLADHSKFTKNGLFQLAPLTDFDLVIVDAATPESEVEAQRARGVRLHVLGRDGAPSWPAPTDR